MHSFSKALHSSKGALRAPPAPRCRVPVNALLAVHAQLALLHEVAVRPVLKVREVRADHGLLLVEVLAGGVGLEGEAVHVHARAEARGQQLEGAGEAAGGVPPPRAARHAVPPGALLGALGRGGALVQDHQRLAPVLQCLGHPVRAHEQVKHELRHPGVLLGVVRLQPHDARGAAPNCLLKALQGGVVAEDGVVRVDVRAAGALE
mmetsp:Transcript_23636/g.60710  ORF Transcript_23636/g.60710 Transcript_23636/m.60710 type:complete len:205 (-) Transcript_23636:1341-1955(-)